MLAHAAAQDDDDVSASYDYDGTLILNSRNFRGMTQQGVWVVMFFSYQVVIKSTDEAMHCQRFTWLWGDLANRYEKLGGETRSGPVPSIHIAKYDATDERERRFVGSLIGGERVDALPAIFIFEGGTVRKFPDWEMSKMIADLPDIDRLEGYDQNMECDPPADYYEALMLNEVNLKRLGYFIGGYLADTNRQGLHVPRERKGEATYSDSAHVSDVELHDPAEVILEEAREAVASDDAGGFAGRLARLVKVNETDINSRCPLSFQTALHLAAGGGEVEVATLLLTHGADLEATDEQGELPLHKAAEAGRRGVLRVLLQHGARLDVPRLSDGATPLHLAAYTGQGDVAALLVAEGADLEARTPKGQSPLHFAAISGYTHDTNAVELLLPLGADIDAADHAGWTPLMLTILAYQPEMLLKLCELGADVAAADVAGNTALHHAMHYGHVDQVHALLRFGADPHARNRQGERAMDVMARDGNYEDSLKTGELVWSGRKQAELNRLVLPYRRWYLSPLLWALDGLPGAGTGLFRPDYSHKLVMAERRMAALVQAGAEGLRGYFRRHWHTWFGRHLMDSTTLSKYHEFTQQRLLEVEEFHDKQTLGGDFEGDVWLFKMGNPEFEMLKSWSELQRAVYFKQAWLVERLLQAGVVEGVGAPETTEADTGQILVPSGACIYVCMHT